MLPTEFMIRGLLAAVIVYLPVSLVWVFISATFYRQYGYSGKIFGVPSEFVGYGILSIGIALVASYILLAQINIAKLGFVLAFAGVDWILTLREGRERGRNNQSGRHT